MTIKKLTIIFQSNIFCFYNCTHNNFFYNASTIRSPGYHVQTNSNWKSHPSRQTESLHRIRSIEERNLVDEYALAIQRFKFTKEIEEAADRGPWDTYRS